MTTTQIIKSTGLDPCKPVLLIDVEDAIERFLEFIEEWELKIKIAKINRQDWETLLTSYGDAIVNYHPENDHQERAVFLKNKKMLKKYGLTDEEIWELDFV